MEGALRLRQRGGGRTDTPRLAALRPAIGPVGRGEKGAAAIDVVAPRREGIDRASRDAGACAALAGHRNRRADAV